jgi:hypothetical protein
VLIRGVVEHQVGDHAHAALVSGVQQRLEILERAKIGVDGGVIGDIVAIVQQGGRVHRHQPQAIYP